VSETFSGEKRPIRQASWRSEGVEYVTTKDASSRAKMPCTGKPPLEKGRSSEISLSQVIFALFPSPDETSFAAVRGIYSQVVTGVRKFVMTSFSFHVTFPATAPNVVDWLRWMYPVS